MKHSSGFRKNKNLLFHLVAFFVAAVWGVSFVSTKKLLEADIQPTEIYVLRFSIAYIVICFFTFKRILADSFKDEMLFLLCGLCGGSIYYIGENMALEYTLVTNVSLLVSLSPIITVLLTSKLYKSEQLSREFALGSVIAFLGVACVIFNGSGFKIEVNAIGDLLSIFAAISFAIYCIVVKKLNDRYDTLFITRKIFFYGVITSLPFLLFQDHYMDFAVLKDGMVWVHILFLGLICSMLAFLLWNDTIKRLGANRASNYLYFSPLITLVASVWILDEPVSLIGYIGCILIIGGVIVSEKLKLKK